MLPSVSVGADEIRSAVKPKDSLYNVSPPRIVAKDLHGSVQTADGYGLSCGIAGFLCSFERLFHVDSFRHRAEQD